MKMRMKQISSFLLALVLLCSVVSAFAGSNNYTNANLPDTVVSENNPTLTLRHKIYIENFAGGVVSVVDKAGKHTVIGSVYRPATLAKDSSDGFWAAHYDKASDGTFSCVTATAANAMHLKVGPKLAYNPLSPYVWMPKQVSVGIKEDYTYANGSYSDAMIYTSVPGGTNIFGGYSAPYVGNPVKYLNASGVWESLDLYYNNDYTKPVPKRLIIEVYEASTEHGRPDYIEFENWAKGDTVANTLKTSNGRILVHYPDGTLNHVADVIQRVRGTGRFVGSEYAEVGRLRAAHPGVICFSTSPKVGFTHDANKRGGFQFVPANHAKFLSYDLQQDSFIGRDQWGIVAYVGASKDILYNPDYVIDGHVSYDPIWEGVAPLFAEFINPRNDPNNQQASTYFQVSTDFGVTWSDCPTIIGVTDSSTNSPVGTWTNIRLYVK